MRKKLILEFDDYTKLFPEMTERWSICVISSGQYRQRLSGDLLKVGRL